MNATAETPTPAAPPPSNVEVGARIGLSHSGISRIRSGDRVPSIARMRSIEKEYGWPLLEQIAADERGEYAAAFEAVLCRGTDAPSA